MRDEECVKFLQWALPSLHLQWPGFRKVRAQVCKRLQRRINELTLDDIVAYRDYLAAHNAEWQVLDALCRVSISRFYRDKQMFVFLEQVVLPELAQRALARGAEYLHVWCVGAGSGEEPYTLAILWQLQLQHRFPDLRLRIVATDADPNMLQRSKVACYDYSSIKNLPQGWRQKAFVQSDLQYCLKPEYQTAVEFSQHDIREEFAGIVSDAAFDLMLCRNLVFTYFDEPLQQQTLVRLMRVLRVGGALVIGIHETLPQIPVGIRQWSDRLRIFEKRETHDALSTT